MQSKGGCLIPLAIFGILAVVVLVSAAGEIKTYSTNETVSGYNEQAVDMVNPNGYNTSRDLVYSEVNQANADANAQNAEVLKIQAEATLIAAQACDLRNDCHAPYGYDEDKGDIPLLLIAVVLVAVVGFMWVVMNAASKGPVI